MALDYREPRIVNKNKPRRRPFGVIALAIAAMAMLVYGLGVASGWFACLYKIRKTAAVQQPALPAVPTSSGTHPPLPAAPLNKQGEVPLTFYETLPKGGTVVIGSGINPKRLEQQPSAPPVQATPIKPSVPPQQPAQTAKLPAPQQAVPVKPPAALKPASTPAPLSASKPPAPVVQEKSAASRLTEENRRFTVQVASIRDKADAEVLRNKLQEKGFNPSMVEVRIPDKGIVYRVRAGRRLQQREAQELAGRLGSGAIVIPE